MSRNITHPSSWRSNAGKLRLLPTQSVTKFAGIYFPNCPSVRFIQAIRVTRFCSLYNHTEKNYVLVYTTNVHFVSLRVVGWPISCMTNKLRISSDRFIILILESVEMTMFKHLRLISATKRSAPCISSISRTCSILIYAAPEHALP